MSDNKVIRRKRRKPLQKQTVVVGTIDPDDRPQDRRGRPRTSDRQARGQKPFFGHFDAPVYDVLTSMSKRWHTSMIGTLTRLLCDEESRFQKGMASQPPLEPKRQVEVEEILSRKPSEQRALNVATIVRMAAQLGLSMDTTVDSRLAEAGLYHALESEAIVLERFEPQDRFLVLKAFHDARAGAKLAAKRP